MHKFLSYRFLSITSYLAQRNFLFGGGREFGEGKQDVILQKEGRGWSRYGTSLHSVSGYLSHKIIKTPVENEKLLRFTE
jgi:hypothetical protein